jgi:hypothetical protein
VLLCTNSRLVRWCWRWRWPWSLQGAYGLETPCYPGRLRLHRVHRFRLPRRCLVAKPLVPSAIALVSCGLSVWHGRGESRYSLEHAVAEFNTVAFGFLLMAGMLGVQRSRSLDRAVGMESAGCCKITSCACTCGRRELHVLSIVLLIHISCILICFAS